MQSRTSSEMQVQVPGDIPLSLQRHDDDLNKNKNTPKASCVVRSRVISGDGPSSSFQRETIITEIIMGRKTSIERFRDKIFRRQNHLHFFISSHLRWVER